MRGRKQKTDFVVFADKVLAWKRIKRPKTVRGAELHFGRLKHYFKDRQLPDVNEDAWMDYCVWRREQKPGCRLYDDRKALKAILIAARRQGLVTRDVALQNPDEKREVGREIVSDEIVKLKAAAGTELRFQIEIALKMGMRLREMLHLRWERIHWERQIIRLLPCDTKTKKGRTIPINPDVYPELLRRYQERKSPFVFPSRHDLNKPQHDNKTAWKLCKKRAGISCRWHDWRHTCATLMLRRGVSVSIAAKVLGMGERVLTNIYQHLDDEDLWIAARVMSEKKEP